MRLILPLILLLLGTGGGVGAALFLFPPEPEHDEAAMVETDPCGDPAEDHAAAEPVPEPPSEELGREYVRLNNQFVIPVVTRNEVQALVVMSLSLEVVSGTQDTAFAMEPKLRDAFLQVLFDHANVGGFDGVFTSGSNMRVLRNALLAAAQDILGPSIVNVLIFDLVRQDA
jgi:hypothetical protein